MKKLIPALIAALVIPNAAYADYTSTICTNNVIVEGYLSDVEKDKSLYVLLEKDGEVKYINDFDIKANGQYIAKFKFTPDSDISNYTVRVKAGDEDATDSVLLAVAEKEAMQFDVKLKNSDGLSFIDETGTVNISAGIKNYYGDADECTMVAAVYDASGKLISAQSKPIDISYDIENTVGTWSINAQGADSVKVLVWDKIGSMIPLADATVMKEQTYGADVMADTSSDITAVFLGDSIYAGAGATSESAYLEAHMEKYFDETYNSATVINAGIGGTYSDQGLYRLKTDVAVYNPDIVFIDFAWNDRWYSEDNYIAYMEGMIRELIKLPHQPVIVLQMPFINYTDLNAVNYPENIDWAEELAAHYGITVANYYDYIQSEISAGTYQDMTDFASKYSGDNIHPNDAGYELMAEHLISCISDGSAYKKYELMDVYGSHEYNNPGLVSPVDDRIEYSGTWQYKAEASSDTFDEGSYLSTNGGDTITFTFKGNSFGVYAIRSFSGNSASYSIDNGAYRGTIDTYGVGPMPMTIGERHDLSDGEHTVTITTNTPQDGKNQFEIGYFLTDEN